MSLLALTRLTGESILVNLQQIESVEQAHDTRITLCSGRQIFVAESAEMIAEIVGALRAPSPPPAEPT